MALLLQILIFFHVITASAWFGMALRLASQGRKVRTMHTEGTIVLAQEALHTVQQMGLFLVLTFVFSMGVLVLGGGYSGQFQYHLASLLIVILMIVQFFLIRPTWHEILTALEAGNDPQTLITRATIGTGTGHLLWIALLLLMFWNRFVTVV